MQMNSDEKHPMGLRVAAEEPVTVACVVSALLIVDKYAVESSGRQPCGSYVTAEGAATALGLSVAGLPAAAITDASCCVSPG